MYSDIALNDHQSHECENTLLSLAIKWRNMLMYSIIMCDTALEQYQHQNSIIARLCDFIEHYV